MLDREDIDIRQDKDEHESNAESDQASTLTHQRSVSLPKLGG
jgi:hypothetical protein